MSEKRKQKRQFWIILTIVFIGFVGISMPYLIFPALFLNPEYSILPADWGIQSQALLLGITLAAYPLGQFVGSPILGALSDDYGRKWLLSASLVISGFCNLLTGFAIEQHLLWLLITSRFAAGLMEGNVAIARAMAADLKTLSKHETFGQLSAATSISYLIGPFLGGLMADKNILKSLTVSTPFYVICILFFGLAALSALFLEKKKAVSLSKVQTFWERINFIKRVARLFSNKRLQFLMVVSTAFTLAVDIFYEFGPVHLTVKWTLSPAQLTLYNGILCIALAIGNGWMASFFARRISSRLAILCSIGGFSLCLLGIVLTNATALMLLLFALSGLVIGVGATLLTVKISDSAPDSIQGEVLGTQVSLRFLGDAIICLFGSALLVLSSKLILIVAAAIAIAIAAYYAALRS